jgi:hypothetical protein
MQGVGVVGRGIWVSTDMQTRVFEGRHDCNEGGMEIKDAPENFPPQ